MKRLLALLLGLGGIAGSLSAQLDWYVDPAAGDNGNSGWNQGDAFQTLTYALTRAAPGEVIFCLPGNYSAASGETFPIGVRDGIHVSGLGGPAVFDGAGTGVLFQLDADVTQETVIRDLSLTNAALLFSIQSGRAVAGLVVQDCSFSDCAAGFAAVCSTNALGQKFKLSGCTFTALAGATAISVDVSDGALEGGGIISNRVLGNFAAGIVVTASDDAEIASSFALQRNYVAGCDDGIRITASGSGGNDLNVATIAAALTANFLDGSRGAGGVGLSLRAETGALDENALVACAVSFCEIADFGVAVRVSTANDGGNRADVIADFYGNLLRGAQTGVQIEAVQPNAQQRNADPNFGGHPAGGFASLNTFRGFTLEFDLGPAALYACCNWFDGLPLVQGGTLISAPTLNPGLEASVSGSVRPGLEGEVVTLNASERSGFVDSNLGGLTGQIAVELDGVALAQTSLSAPQPGSQLAITLPSLADGQHTLMVTNPGGQFGNFVFFAEGSSDDDSCFVATAAHGSANAPEVLALRGLRDEYLVTSAAGRGFIRWYYREGPAAAAWIAERPWARAGARVALQPAVVVARALTRWNPGQRFACAVLLLGAAFALLRRRAP